MSKYYSIHEFSKIIGVSAQTLRNWDANGKLHPHHTTVSGYRYYSDEQLSQVINVKPKNRITIGYCRVSSHKQKDDLERQIDNVKTDLLAKGQPFEIISDIGSGINYKKKGLQELIRRISQNQVEKVVVLYKDRLLRFGFELIEYIASLYNCEIEIIDNTEKSEQQELVEDLVQIITVFSCKLQGKRANKAKKLIRELIQEETDGKSHKSNADTKQAIKDACTAYKNFFKGLQKFPRFKSRKRSMPKFYQDNVKIQFSNTHVKLEGFSSSRKANKQKRIG